MAEKESKPNVGKQIRHRVEAALFQVAVWLAPHLPRKFNYALASMLAGIAVIFCAEDRMVALANLDIAFGDSMSPADKKRIARKSFGGLSRNLCDLLWAAGQSVDSLQRLTENNQRFRQTVTDLQASRKGVILTLCHIGNWEVAGLIVGTGGTKMTTIAEPGTNPHIDDMITIARRSTGHRIVPPRNSMLAMVRAAVRCEPVTLFIDANARRGRGGIWVDFFGLPVYQSVAAAELAIRSNGSILCTLPVDLPGGRIRVDFAGIIDSASTVAADHDERVRELTVKTLKVYEDYIRQHPDQWLWTYKRWKRRPMVEKGKFPFYSKYYAEPPATKSVEA